MECVIACDGVDVKVSFNGEFSQVFGGSVHDGREVASWFGVCAGAFVRTRSGADGSGVFCASGGGVRVGSVARLECGDSPVTRYGDIVGVRGVEPGGTLEGDDISRCHGVTNNEGNHVVVEPDGGYAVGCGADAAESGLPVSAGDGVEIRELGPSVGKHECASVTGGVVDSGDKGGRVVTYGPNGGLSFGRGPNYERNRAKREKVRGVRGGVGQVVKERTALQMSLEAKWESENMLAKEKADRQLELLRSRDLESEKRMQRAQIMRTTEAAKVQTERAYASLKRTGNVPGFAETVVTDGSCPALSPNRSDGTCISPDSSVSQQEIRAMMKENEDLKLTLKRIERDNPALVAHHMEGHGVKTAFTLDSDGMCPVDEPGCMGIDGKYHLDSYERNPKFYKDRFRAEEATERYFNRE